jgi:hypothetical protein
MSDLAKRVRGMANDLNVDFCAPTLNEAADRIEALEAALRRIAHDDNVSSLQSDPDNNPRAIASAALTPEQDK